MFNGFTDKTSEFFIGITLNNEKTWFEANRESYEQHLKLPLRELGTETAELMNKRFPNARLNLHIARIQRDARRLHGKGPYKDHLWFSLKSSDGLLEGPMFWFEIGATEYGYGMGIYSADPRQMEAYRKAIDGNLKAFERLVLPVEKQSLFRIDGEEYKKPKGDRGELINKWYNRKSVGLTCMKDFGGDLLSPRLPEVLVEGYSFLMPYYEFLCKHM
jgi:uncharacterized protein (TIGR02453 family)